MDLLRYMAPLSATIAAKTKLVERLASSRWNVYQKMIALHGEDADMRHTKRFSADMVSVMILCAIGLILCGIATRGDVYVMVALLALAGFTPFLMMKRLEGQIADKKRKLVMELPELLNKLTLLINAGETVQGAIMRCADMYASKGDGGPLAAEFVMLANRLRNNESFPIAMEKLSKRCLVAEVSVFTTTVLMNYRRGGELFVMSLRSLNRDLWEKRKAMTRILGEEASAKLIFPMLLILFAVMIIVAAPAVMLMD
ncbi:type II secretion protein F [Paenibacillus hemerocallicola]|uniref:Type II secretion protein F n=1 Tax=Paenibacillus hemerocallicola TaxID=1172614 RepID=A0A5C4THG2_9BACL|nr:type II secretion system F family protein [Paenibacillus hemerocallicola]TNJ68182.1 type II secretion protein F [Paenibacillus hemerocallicola]